MPLQGWEWGEMQLVSLAAVGTADSWECCTEWLQQGNAMAAQGCP